MSDATLYTLAGLAVVIFVYVVLYRRRQRRSVAEEA